jgi:hypothetical protein
MRNSRRAFLALLLLGLGAGCRWPWEPESVPIRGYVRYPNGERAVAVKVGIGDRVSTFTDWSGEYSFLSTGNPGDTVTVFASEPCRGECSETRSGGSRVVLRRGKMVVDIVLDRLSPI